MSMFESPAVISARVAVNYNLGNNNPNVIYKTVIKTVPGEVLLDREINGATSAADLLDIPLLTERTDELAGEILETHKPRLDVRTYFRQVDSKEFFKLGQSSRTLDVGDFSVTINFDSQNKSIKGFIQIGNEEENADGFTLVEQNFDWEVV